MANDTGWGGPRPNSGRKKKWKAPGKTTAIRVPVEYEKLLLRYAREIDELRYGEKKGVDPGNA